jgi:hypothetical protein
MDLSRTGLNLMVIVSGDTEGFREIEIISRVLLGDLFFFHIRKKPGHPVQEPESAYVDDYRSENSWP